MRAVIQRVSKASVEIDGETKGKINKGVLILLGIENEDTQEDIQWLSAKIAKLRIFPDDEGVNNLSLLDVEGEGMVISQFTLHASTKKGNRPSYLKAAKPDVSIPLYNQFIEHFEGEIGKKVATGEFGAHMNITLTNDGPVTILIDTKNKE
ncbi:MAG: D-tyrosyl-tRNA(Tyr) deacylase [Bacteroidales bacterium]|nr:D-tyrosyl-tRNA(Tyr) deacylase [Bacteroidales bacterium]MCF8333866.1 D-tyrosyl-tRNA(Tyr) deacylase [Bacteroidales bacterium]